MGTTLQKYLGLEIVTSEVRPPIPTKDFDFCAYFKGEEEKQQYGWGETAELAVTDLKLKFEEGFYE